MKTNFRTTANALCLYSFLLVVTPGCRSTTVPPSAGPETAQETAKVEAPTAEIPPVIAEPLPSPPAKEIIARRLPESLIAAPARDVAARQINYNTIIGNRPGESPRVSAWQYRSTRQGQLVGFEFSNHGGNRILPPRRDAVKNQFFTRDFQFRFDDRARQDIHLMVSDWVPSRDRIFRLSELMNSLILFFPRNFLPAIVTWKNRNIVTLPTGEEVEFNPLTHEILGGVFAEAPVDLNPDRSRKFPGITYNGKGVAIRADARGTDPRLGTSTLITTGSPAKDCDRGIFCSQCEVKPQELWEQSGAARFKFATDADLDRFLVARCGFGLPRIGSEFAIAAATDYR